MDFKKWDKIIEENKFDMLFMIIYYNLKCNEDYDISIECGKAKEELEYLINFIHKAYLKDENHIDLGLICDKAVEYKNEILKNNVEIFNVWDLLNKCSKVL